MTVALDKKRFGPWALVTGASSGIGKEFAQQIAASGINIVLVARREDLLKEVGVEFSKRYGVEHRVVVLDVSREDFIRQLASATDDLDIGLVVSNAGTGNPGEFLKLDRQLLEETLRLNTMSHLDIAHYFGGKLAERRRGGLILVGAMGAENGIPCMANDGGAKAYVHSLGEALHYEFKPLGVHVTVLAAGITNTAVMGLKEETVQGIGFKSLAIFRPGIIVGNAHTPGYAAWLGRLIPGPFGTIEQDDIGRAFAAEFISSSAPNGVVYLENAAMKQRSRGLT